MATKFVKRTKYSTPVGTAIYPYLTKPDEFKGKKSYRVRLLLTAAEAQPLIAMIDAEMEKVRAEERVMDAIKRRKVEQKAKKGLPDITEHTPYRPVINDQGEDTGLVEFDFKCAAEGVYGPTHKRAGEAWTRKPAVFDAKGGVFSGGDIWGGSRIRVSYTLGGYFINAQVGYGVKLYLEAAKVIELVTGSGGRNASEFGFGGEEDGYVSDPMTADESKTETATADDAETDF